VKSVPLRIELGPKDLEAGHVVLKRRDATDKKASEIVKWADLSGRVPMLLEIIQADMLAKAKATADSRCKQANTWCVVHSSRAALRRQGV
jgi:prolyl-tRNA synthetase